MSRYNMSVLKNIGIDRTYVISLPNDKQRLLPLSNSLLESGITYIKYYAVDGNTLNLSEYPHAIGAKMRRGSLGCFLSHLNLWKIVESGDDEIVLILEDDANICRNFVDVLSNYIRNIPDDWDIVYLGYHNLKGTRYNTHFYKPVLENKKGINAGFFGYLVRKKTVANLIKKVTPIKNVYIDVVIRENFRTVNAYFADQKLITERGTVSTRLTRDADAAPTYRPPQQMIIEDSSELLDRSEQQDVAMKRLADLLKATQKEEPISQSEPIKKEVKEPIKEYVEVSTQTEHINDNFFTNYLVRLLHEHNRSEFSQTYS